MVAIIGVDCTEFVGIPKALHLVAGLPWAIALVTSFPKMNLSIVFLIFPFEYIKGHLLSIFTTLCGIHEMHDKLVLPPKQIIHLNAKLENSTR